MADGEGHFDPNSHWWFGPSSYASDVQILILYMEGFEINDIVRWRFLRFLRRWQFISGTLKNGAAERLIFISIITGIADCNQSDSIRLNVLQPRA